MHPETYLELHRQRERELEAGLAWALAHRDRRAAGAAPAAPHRSRAVPLRAVWHRVAAAPSGVAVRVRALLPAGGLGPAPACCPAV